MSAGFLQWDSLSVPDKTMVDFKPCGREFDAKRIRWSDKVKGRSIAVADSKFKGCRNLPSKLG
jgi:hypothetical protein